jgi:hypothetical protein
MMNTGAPVTLDGRLFSVVLDGLVGVTQIELLEDEEAGLEFLFVLAGTDTIFFSVFESESRQKLIVSLDGIRQDA